MPADLYGTVAALLAATQATSNKLKADSRAKKVYRKPGGYQAKRNMLEALWLKPRSDNSRANTECPQAYCREAAVIVRACGAYLKAPENSSSSRAWKEPTHTKYLL